MTDEQQQALDPDPALVVEAWGLGVMGNLANTMTYIIWSERSGNKRQSLEQAQWYLQQVIGWMGKKKGVAKLAINPLAMFGEHKMAYIPEELNKQWGFQGHLAGALISLYKFCHNEPLLIDLNHVAHHLSMAIQECEEAENVG